MDTTPLKSKLLCKESRKNKNDDISPRPTVTTPTQANMQKEQGDYSPVYFQLTQEGNEEIDVLWDWYSPQTSQRRKKKKLMLPSVQSPKFPIRRHPSNSQSNNFEKLRSELKALQEELAELPDDESSLCVSPQHEVEYKMHTKNNFKRESDQHFENNNEIFNDSIDEQLMLFSQEIESVLDGKSNLLSNEENKSILPVSVCDNIKMESLINKYTKDKEEYTKTNTKLTLPRCVSEDLMHNVIQTASGKLELHRTKSFELAGKGNLHEDKLKEIERKRLEALARLESKKKQNTILTSPVKYSSEDIEKKRQQALSKLEAKRLQDIVEKKRQEALKKLQESRKKYAQFVKSTPTKRL